MGCLPHAATGLILTMTPILPKVDPGYLFNYAAVNWAGTRTGGDFYIPLSMSSQCQVDGGLDYGGWDESVYTISPYSTGNVWKHYYSVGGNNLMLAIKNAEESDPVNHNAIAQCKILLAEHMYEATMLWGDIPFTESWNGTIKYPKFDSQESVLNGVLSLLDEALQVMDLNDANAIDEYDIYYKKGDMNKWMTLAKSLKFRTLMVMVDKILLRLLLLVRCCRLEEWFHQHQIIWYSLILQTRAIRILNMNLWSWSVVRRFCFLPAIIC